MPPINTSVVEPDPLEPAIEAALVPGEFVPERFTFDLVDRLEDVRAKIVDLVTAGEAARAGALLAGFLAACHAKAEEIDDSSGFFGDFAGSLARDWILARQAARAAPVEIVATVRRWVEVDEYGFLHDLSVGAVGVLDDNGLAAMEDAAAHGFESATPDSYERRREAETLKAIHVHRIDVAAYAALCDASGGATPKDCACLANNDAADALAWVDRGLEPAPEQGGRRPLVGAIAWGLPRLRRECLDLLGRGDESLDSAWQEYRRHPGPRAFEEPFQYVPPGERDAWQVKALDALVGGHLPGAIEILVSRNEIERLVALVEGTDRQDLQDVSHTVLEPAAEALAGPHPETAASVRIALGLRIVDAKKSRYYHAALHHLEIARDLLLTLGRESEWRELVTEIRSAHRRKSSFMPGFERLVSGWRSADQPSFVESARLRWERRMQSGSGDGRAPGPREQS